MIQLSMIVMSFEKSTFAPTARPIPTTPPTTDWEVETGILKKVARVTKKPEQMSKTNTAKKERSSLTIPFPIVFIT